MLVFLQFVIFFMGLAAAGFAIYFILFFSRSKRPLSFAMIGFLAEQIVSSLGTLVFTASSVWAAINGVDPSHWNMLSPLTASFIRACMFGAMLHSTINLSMKVRHIQREMEKKDGPH